ncbi:hypothetical protein AURDEDRAFT_113101 [Auricularia subglabra TFB-10046 SS5]|nr:hypothetical protein AURDEDRAFT_113101 [Auricularia subglabra TFB-10046 SS5]
MRKSVEERVVEIFCVSEAELLEELQLCNRASKRVIDALVLEVHVQPTHGGQRARDEAGSQFRRGVIERDVRRVHVREAEALHDAGVERACDELERLDAHTV